MARILEKRRKTQAQYALEKNGVEKSPATTWLAKNLWFGSLAPDANSGNPRVAAISVPLIASSNLDLNNDLLIYVLVAFICYSQFMPWAVTEDLSRIIDHVDFQRVQAFFPVFLEVLNL